MEPHGGGHNEEVHMAIKQIVSFALHRSGYDIYSAAGIKTPEFPFLRGIFKEVRNMKHKNVALELLKKLLT